MSESNTKTEAEQFRQAVERKNAEAREQAEASREQAEESSLRGSDRPQDQPDPRTKSSGHKKHTADKWNQ